MGAASDDGGGKQARPAYADVLTAFLTKGRDRNEGQQQQQQKTLLHSFVNLLPVAAGAKTLRVCQFMEPACDRRSTPAIVQGLAIKGTGRRVQKNNDQRSGAGVREGTGRTSRRKLKGEPRSAAVALTHLRK